MTTNYPNDKSIYEYFNKVDSRRSRRSSNTTLNSPITQQNDTNEVYYDCKTFLTNIAQLEDDNIRYLRTSLFSLNKHKIEKMYLYCNSSKEHSIRCSMTPFLIPLVKDMCLYKLNRISGDVAKMDIKQFLIVEFSNKLVEQINLKQIMKSPQVIEAFPGDSITNSLREPSIAYKYTNTIRSKIVNYKQAIIDETEQPAICNCSNYPQYIDNHHKHVITGDLSIIENNTLRRLLNKGLNYREQQPPNKTKAYNSILSAIDSYIRTLTTSLKKPLTVFTSWKKLIMDRVKKHFEIVKPYKFNKVLKNGSDENNILTKLHKDLVMVPVDKAGNNIAIICKSYYISLLNNEILSSNFTEVDSNVEDILNRHKTFLLTNSLELSNKNNKLPFLYLTAKMHKTPTSSRFITSGKFSSLSELSEKVGLCLKMLLVCARNNSSYESKYEKHKKNYFIIDNNSDVTRFLERSNNLKEKHKSIETYDFKTLYTSISHDLLKEKLKCFVEEIAVKKDKKCVIPKRKNAYFSNKKNNNGLSIKQLIECLHFVIDNSYVLFKKKVYRQVVGIPMGTNCAPHLANIFLHMYEKQFIKSLNDKGKEKVSGFLNHMFRYQDDCLVLNDYRQFKRYINTIYPDVMVLENTNVNRVESNYLDLNIKLENGYFQYKSYDKRDDYNFDVIRYPNLSGNIPCLPSYGVFVSQCKRFSEINNCLEHFVNDIKMLQSRLLKQGFLKQKLRERFNTFANKNFRIWSKFGEDIRDSGIADYIFM